jgi:hypothetical protein
MKVAASIVDSRPREKRSGQEVSGRVDAAIARLSPQERMPLVGPALEVLRRERWCSLAAWGRKALSR